MILTVTLNSAVDVGVFGGTFAVHRENRGIDVDPDAGGKGNNVARVARLLGTEVTATGFLGGFTGDFIEHTLVTEGVIPAFVRLRGTTRITTVYVDEKTGKETKITPAGPEIGTDEREEFLAAFSNLLAGSGVSSVVLAGSLPRNLEDDFYIRLSTLAAGFRVPVIIDTSGAALSAAAGGTFRMMKPNAQEAAELCGTTDRSRIIAGLRKRSAPGRAVCLTLGAEGAMLFEGDRILSCRCSPACPVNAVGSGDAFVAGYVSALERKKSEEECLAWAVAAATCTAESTGLLWDPSRFGEALSRIHCRSRQGEGE